MSRRMSRKALLEKLKSLLLSPQVALSRGHLRRERGITDYDRDKETGDLINIKITIDPRNSPVVTIVIHELLHVYVAKYHEIDRLFTEPLEEAMVEGLADELEMYLNRIENERLFQTWVRMVDEKLWPGKTASTTTTSSTNPRPEAPNTTSQADPSAGVSPRASAPVPLPSSSSTTPRTD
jgi:hypothetical protein